MFNLSDLKNFDLKQLDPTRLDLTGFDLRNIDLPKFDAEQLPSFDFPKFEMPVEATRLAEFARDSAYAGAGAAVVAVQKADEYRRELTDQVTAQVRKFVDTVS